MSCTSRAVAAQARGQRVYHPKVRHPRKGQGKFYDGGGITPTDKKLSVERLYATTCHTCGGNKEQAVLSQGDLEDELKRMEEEAQKDAERYTAAGQILPE